MKRSGLSHLSWLELHWTKPLDVGEATLLLERLATAPELGTLVLEVRACKSKDNSSLHWLVGVSKEHRPELAKLLTQLLPVCVTKLNQDASTKARLPVNICTKVKLSKPALSLGTDRLTAISRALLVALSSINQGETVVIQTILGQRLLPHIVDSKQAPEPSWFDLLLGSKRELPASEATALKRRHAHHGFKAHIRLGATSGNTVRAYQLIRQVYGALRVAEAAGSHLHLSTDKPGSLNNVVRPWRYTLTLSSLELCGVIGLPVGEALLSVVGGSHPLQLMPANTLAHPHHSFARLVAPGSNDKVGISPKDSLYHSVLLGPTGSGKSTAMLSLIEASLKAGQGVLVIDPKTDLVNDVLSRIPNSRTQDVVVVDPVSIEPVGLNPLQDSSRTPELVADSLLSSFKQLFSESWGVRTEDILTAGLLTLARTRDANLIWLPTLLSDAAFRRKLLAHIHDPLGVGAFWQRYESKRPDQQQNEIQPVLNKLRQFLLRPAMRAVLGQSKPKFNLKELLTSRKIVLVSLNKGILGAESARLLGSLIVGQLWPLILERAKLAASRRAVVSVYIDEVQDYLKLPVDLADALAQARSLGVGFCLAHQYRAQLSKDMRAAIDTNCRNKIVFGLASADDARDMSRQAPELDAQDFMLLSQYHAYANLMQDTKASGWIMLKTNAPSLEVSDPVELRALSAERYGVSAKETESELITLLRGDLTTTDAATGTSPIGRKSRP